MKNVFKDIRNAAVKAVIYTSIYTAITVGLIILIDFVDDWKVDIFFLNTPEFLVGILTYCVLLPIFPVAVVNLVRTVYLTHDRNGVPREVVKNFDYWFMDVIVTFITWTVVNSIGWSALIAPAVIHI